MFKNIIIGVLVAYVVIDVLLSVTGKSSMPSLLEKLFSNMSNTTVMMVTVAGLILGAVTWYALNKYEPEVGPV
jgi:hypothetical protein